MCGSRLCQAHTLLEPSVSLSSPPQGLRRRGRGLRARPAPPLRRSAPALRGSRRAGSGRGRTHTGGKSLPPPARQPPASPRMPLQLLSHHSSFSLLLHACERKKERPTPVSRRALRGHSLMRTTEPPCLCPYRQAAAGARAAARPTAAARRCGEARGGMGRWPRGRWALMRGLAASPARHPPSPALIRLLYSSRASCAQPPAPHTQPCRPRRPPPPPSPPLPALPPGPTSCS